MHSSYFRVCCAWHLTFRFMAGMENKALMKRFSKKIYFQIKKHKFKHFILWKTYGQSINE
jgi:hypothetical protein